ncbi:hypothetical protein TRFO_23142 [Tritrichomonas foetus]|uniref:MatE family protein n=1 Tax=Tritrichomonas foetus TaxID=1144522 RepID=A0A1J4KGA1_9EUKA|nr:hypothetical protein TRFO_23142 [Tritrichomonas foetus]|eukprot:OHT08381.1 hypothetical protein TRFO_23142 [Tritrichomonas foetus]
MQEPLINENEKKEIVYNQSEVSAAELEKLKFTKHSPLVTLLLFSIGSATNLIQVTGEAVDQFLVSERWKNDPENSPMHLYGFCNIVIQTYVYMGIYFGQVALSSVPKLIGAGLRDEAAQFAADTYRCAWITSLLFPIGFYFVIKPFVTFVGCPEDSIQDAIYFCLPPTIGMIVIVSFNLTIAVLMSIGRADLAAFLRCSAYIFQSGFITPILLFVIKITLEWIRSSMVWAELLFTSVFLYLIFGGKLTLKPKFSMLIKKFHPKFPHGLALGLPKIFSFLCLALPPTIILQCLTSAVPEHSKSIAAVFGVFNRMSTYVNSFPAIFTTALLSVGTHAYGRKDIMRLEKYVLWTLLLSTSLNIIFELVMTLCPRFVAGIFLHNEMELKLSETILKIPFLTAFIQPFIFTCNMLLIILGRSIIALCMSGLQTVSLCVGCKIIQKLFPSSPYNVMYIYNFTDVMLAVSYLFVMIYPIKKMREEHKESTTTTSMLSTIVEDSYDPIGTYN